MYTYISAVAQTSAFDGQYKPVNLTTLTLAQIYQTYPSVYVTLYNEPYTREETLNLADLHTSVQSSQETIVQWLLNNGNNTLPTTLVPPTFTYHRAQFYDATYAGFKALPGNVHYHPDTELTYDQKKDVFLIKSGVDYETIRDRCLFTVNGYIHYADASANGIVLYDAMRSLKNLNKNLIGIVDFQRLGALSFHPIQPEWISKRSEALPYHDVVYLDVPEYTAGKQILLSIGGFLHVDDKLFTLVGDRTLKIDFKRFNWLERFYLLNETHGVDWSGLEHNGDTFAKDGVYSDETLVKLFTLPQSFIIVLDSPQLFVSRLPVEQTNLAGLYYSHEKIGLPLIGGEGLLKEYKHGRYDGQWSLEIDGYLTRTNVLHSTGWWTESDVTHNTQDPNKPTLLSEAHWLVLSKSDTE